MTPVLLDLEIKQETLFIRLRGNWILALPTIFATPLSRP